MAAGDAICTVLIARGGESEAEAAVTLLALHIRVDVVVTGRPHPFVSHQLAPHTIYVCETPDPEIVARRARTLTVLRRPFSVDRLVRCVCSVAGVRPPAVLNPVPELGFAPDLRRLAERWASVERERDAAVRRLHAAFEAHMRIRARVGVHR
jgi:hypothetical protein